MQGRLFRQLSRCLTSHHFQVAERAIYFFNNEYLMSIIAEDAATLMPMVFPALYKSSQTHWNRAINGLILNTFHILMEINRDVYDKCHKEQEVWFCVLCLCTCLYSFTSLHFPASTCLCPPFTCSSIPRFPLHAHSLKQTQPLLCKHTGA